MDYDCEPDIAGVLGVLDEQLARDLSTMREELNILHYEAARLTQRLAGVELKASDLRRRIKVFKAARVHLGSIL